jgi:glycerol-3-phosphate dehydrogenase
VFAFQPQTLANGLSLVLPPYLQGKRVSHLSLSSPDPDTNESSGIIIVCRGLSVAMDPRWTIQQQLQVAAHSRCRVFVVSGPAHAKELLRHMPSDTGASFTIVQLANQSEPSHVTDDDTTQVRA